MRNLLILTAISTLGFVLACAKPGAADVMANTSVVNTPNYTAPAPAQTDEAPRISLADAKKEYDAGTAYIIDARDPSAYKPEHIKGAVNITGEMLKDHIKSLPKDKKIIVYCS